MSAQSTFFYGVFVKSAYLCFASDAYKETKNSLLAIDLICARRRKGNLSTLENDGMLGRVPEEVWKMVSLQVVDLGMKEAEEQSLEKYFPWREDESCSEWLPPSRWTDVIDVTFYGMIEFWESGGTTEMVSSRWKDLRSLLNAIGLALPFTDPYSTRPDSGDDPFAFSAISLPLRSTASTIDPPRFPHLYINPCEPGAAHQILQFSKQALKLPSDADQRIKRFLTFFRLEPINPTSETVYCPRKPKATSSDQSDKESKPRKVTHQSRCCPHSETEPHWHLWGVSHHH